MNSWLCATADKKPLRTRTNRMNGKHEQTPENVPPFRQPGWSNQALLRTLSLAQPTVQTKLAVNHPGDVQGEEAHDIAGELMRTPSGLDTETGAGGNCAGWESDPQSFSIRATERYLRNLLTSAFYVDTVVVTTPPPDWVCRVAVNDGPRTIFLTVKIGLQSKLVEVELDPDPKRHMHCFYSYQCSASGELVLNSGSGDCPSF